MVIELQLACGYGLQTSMQSFIMSLKCKFAINRMMVGFCQGTILHAEVMIKWSVLNLKKFKFTHFSLKNSNALEIFSKASMRGKSFSYKQQICVLVMIRSKSVFLKFCNLTLKMNHIVYHLKSIDKSHVYYFENLASHSTWNYQQRVG